MPTATAKSLRRSIYTTGQIAKICKVAQRTVSKWFDSGRLKGYRIPGSMDRRVPHIDLMRFLEESHMPLHFLEEFEAAVYCVGFDSRLAKVIQPMLTGIDFRCENYGNVFAAAHAIGRNPPAVIMFDLGIGRGAIREVMELAPKSAFIILAPEGTTQNELIAWGYPVLCAPFPPHELTDLLKSIASEMRRK